MRIAVVSSTVFAVGQSGPGGQSLPGYGGLEVIAWETAKGLAAKGHQVTLIAPDGSICPGVTVFHTGPPGGWDENSRYSGFTYNTGRKVKNAQGQEVDEQVKVPPYWPVLLEQDCVVAHDWGKWAIALKAEGILKAPVLCVMHAPVDTMMGSPPPVDKPCIVCISEDQASHWNALHDKPTKRCPAKVAYNGISLEHYKPLNVPRSDRFLFLGRFSSIKGGDICQDVCLKAGVGLDMIGDTKITGEPGYYEQCRRKADGKQIKIYEGVSRGETVWWYSQARGFLHLNARFREPYGLAPVEAMACGNAVLGWRWGALKETVKHGEVGYLVDSQEEAVDIIRSGALDDIDRKRCIEWAAQFSTERMVQRYHDLCTEAVSTGGW